MITRIRNINGIGVLFLKQNLNFEPQNWRKTRTQRNSTQKGMKHYLVIHPFSCFLTLLANIPTSGTLFFRHSMHFSC